MHYLQNRWRLEGTRLVYYGLRNRGEMFRNTVKVSKARADIIATLPRDLSKEELGALRPLLGVQIVTKEEYRADPGSFAEARFCRDCCANDFMIPGLEFDCEGRCPMCQTADKAAKLRAVLPVVSNLPRSKRSRFDVAVFYTGGKDSTFLLYYLSVKLSLRVLALTWEIPFISESAKKSIEAAKEKLGNVEFISRRMDEADLEKFYSKLLELSGNTCACPHPAYVLFYPELVSLRVPYFTAGNEPVQMLGLYYNHFAPESAYSFGDNRALHFLLNAGRILTLRPPLKRGQFHTLFTMRQLAYGDGLVKKISGYGDELVRNISAALREVPELVKPFRRAIRYSSATGRVPAFVHFDFDEICGGVYDWNGIKRILTEECGWIPPDDGGKALHTSCSIERCKDHTQFVRFRNCQSRMIPFSAIEISLASRNCGRSRDELIYEMENVLGFTLDPLPECEMMKRYEKCGK